MNSQKLRDQLILDEGLKLRIYFDSKGYPTMGCGHRITKDDPEYYQALDLLLKKIKKVEITRTRAEELLNNDIKICIENCEKVFPNFEKMKEELQLILANMLFNLGLTKFLKFENLIQAIDKKNYSKAADEMKNSLWYNEVKGRAARLTGEMRRLA